MESVTLSVPYISQTEEGAWGAYDCGQTCVAMLLRYALDIEVTPDELSSIRQGYTDADDLIALGAEYGLVLRRESPFTSAWDVYMLSGKLLQMLQDETPPIVLFNYPKLGPGFGARFGGYHWMVVTGFDGTSWRVNDPLDDAAAGKDKPLSVEHFRRSVVGWVDMVFPAGPVNQPADGHDIQHLRAELAAVRAERDTLREVLMSIRERAGAALEGAKGRRA